MAAKDLERLEIMELKSKSIEENCQSSSKTSLGTILLDEDSDSLQAEEEISLTDSQEHLLNCKSANNNMKQPSLVKLISSSGRPDRLTRMCTSWVTTSPSQMISLKDLANRPSPKLISELKSPRLEASCSFASKISSEEMECSKSVPSLAKIIHPTVEDSSESSGASSLESNSSGSVLDEESSPLPLPPPPEIDPMTSFSQIPKPQLVEKKYFCEICNKILVYERSRFSHNKSKRHKNMLKLRNAQVLTKSKEPSITPETPASITPETPPSITPETPPSITPETPPSITPETPPSITKAVTKKSFCEICDKTFSKESHLNRHKTTIIHQNKAMQKHAGDLVTETEVLSLPIKSSITNQNFLCEICDKRFSCESHLNRHKTTILHKNQSMQKHAGDLRLGTETDKSSIPSISSFPFPVSSSMSNNESSPQFDIEEENKELAPPSPTFTIESTESSQSIEGFEKDNLVDKVSIPSPVFTIASTESFRSIEDIEGEDEEVGKHLLAFFPAVTMANTENSQSIKDIEGEDKEEDNHQELLAFHPDITMADTENSQSIKDIEGEDKEKDNHQELLAFYPACLPMANTENPPHIESEKEFQVVLNCVEVENTEKVKKLFKQKDVYQRKDLPQRNSKTINTSVVKNTEEVTTEEEEEFKGEIQIINATIRFYRCKICLEFYNLWDDFISHFFTVHNLPKDFTATVVEPEKEEKPTWGSVEDFEKSFGKKKKSPLQEDDDGWSTQEEDFTSEFESPSEGEWSTATSSDEESASDCVAEQYMNKKDLERAKDPEYVLAENSSFSNDSDEEEYSTRSRKKKTGVSLKRRKKVELTPNKDKKEESSDSESGNKVKKLKSPSKLNRQLAFCKICNMKLSSEYSLNRHTKRVHPYLSKVPLISPAQRIAAFKKTEALRLETIDLLEQTNTAILLSQTSTESTESIKDTESTEMFISNPPAPLEEISLVQDKESDPSTIQNKLDVMLKEIGNSNAINNNVACLPIKSNDFPSIPHPSFQTRPTLSSNPVPMFIENCLRCDMMFPNELAKLEHMDSLMQGLELHITTNSCPNLICAICDEEFNLWEIHCLTYHLEKEHSMNHPRDPTYPRYRCGIDQCRNKSRTFLSCQFFVHHVKQVHHKQLEPSANSSEMQLRLEKQKNMRRKHTHLKNKLKVKQGLLRCGTCPMVFKNPMDFTMHLFQTKHSLPNGIKEQSET